MLEQRIKGLDWKTFWKHWNTLFADGSCGNPLSAKGHELLLGLWQEFEDQICKANHFTVGVKNMMSFGGEPKEKKENNYECTEIYHLLLPDTFKD